MVLQADQIPKTKAGVRLQVNPNFETESTDKWSHFNASAKSTGAQELHHSRTLKKLFKKGAPSNPILHPRQRPQSE